MSKLPLKILCSLFQKRLIQTKAPTSTIPLSNQPKITEKSKSVITHLKSHHFSDTQIAKLIEKTPWILNLRIQTNLEPKLSFLNANGLKGEFLSSLITMNPLILRRSLKSHLVPSLEFLKTKLGNYNVGVLPVVLKRASWLLTLDLDKILGSNIRLLEKEGMPISSVMKLFVSQPRTLLCNSDRILYGVEMVKKFGFKPGDNMFVHALRVVVSTSESNLRKKIDCFKSLGWSDEDIVSTILKQPLCLTCSEEKLRRSMEFFVETMGVECEIVIANPKLVMYSLKKRVIPRYRVLLVLRENSLLDKWTLPGVMYTTDQHFIRRYITRYIDELPRLFDVYHGKCEVDEVAVKL